MWWQGPDWLLNHNDWGDTDTQYLLNPPLPETDEQDLIHINAMSVMISPSNVERIVPSTSNDSVLNGFDSFM